MDDKSKKRKKGRGTVAECTVRKRRKKENDFNYIAKVVTSEKHETQTEEIHSRTNSMIIDDSRNVEEISEVILKKYLLKIRDRPMKKSKNKKRQDMEDSSDDQDTDREWLNEKKYSRRKRERRKCRNDYLKEIKKLPDYKYIHAFLRDERKSDKPVFNREVPMIWNTNRYLCTQIVKGINTFDWDRVTKLLLYLTDAPNKYLPFLLKASLLTFTISPASQQNNLLEDFLQQCFACHSHDQIHELFTSMFHLEKNNENVL